MVCWNPFSSYFNNKKDTLNTVLNKLIKKLSGILLWPFWMLLERKCLSSVIVVFSDKYKGKEFYKYMQATKIMSLFNFVAPPFFMHLLCIKSFCFIAIYVRDRFLLAFRHRLI